MGESQILKHPKRGFNFAKIVPNLFCAFNRLRGVLVLSFNTIPLVFFPVRSQTQGNIFTICKSMSWFENCLFYKNNRHVGLDWARKSKLSEYV